MIIAGWASSSSLTPSVWSRWGCEMHDELQGVGEIRTAQEEVSQILREALAAGDVVGALATGVDQDCAAGEFK